MVGSVVTQSTYIGNNVFITHSLTVTFVTPAPTIELKSSKVTSGHGNIFWHSLQLAYSVISSRVYVGTVVAIPGNST